MPVTSGSQCKTVDEQWKVLDFHLRRSSLLLRTLPALRTNRSALRSETQGKDTPWGNVALYSGLQLLSSREKKAHLALPLVLRAVPLVHRLLLHRLHLVLHA